MAVRIDVPGVGQITAENAASEETLQAILKALDSQSSSSSKKAKAEKEAEDAAKGRADADKKAAKAGKDFSVGWSAAADGAVKALKNISLTAVSMATNFATNFADIANNPIKETAKVLDTLIDGVAKTTTSLTDAIPVVGGFISALINASAELAKAANKTFADQLQKNIDTLQNYNKAGVSFVGGMNQMNNVAHAAGMSLVDLSKIVISNKETLNKLGMAGGEAAALLGKSMGVAAKQTNKAGLTLRDEMFKMGYSYEEQGAVFSSFMANMAASGKLRSMNEKQVAEETRKYATDLKVISDLTGQDAKKLIERSRAESMRGALMTKLQGDQKDAFIKGSGLLSAKSKDAAAALSQYLTFGNITDPKILANKAMRDMVINIGKEIQAGNKDITNVTQREMANAATNISTSGSKFAEATDKALVAGVGGVAADIATVSNDFVANMGSATPDPNAAKKSAAANEAQAKNADVLADQTAKLYAQTKKQEITMETLVNQHLPKYAQLLKEINDELGGNFTKWLKKTFGEGATMTKEEKAQVAAARQQKNAFGMPMHAGVGDDAVLRGVKQQEWLKQQGITRSPGGVYFGADGTNLGILFDKLPGAPKFDKGGRLGASGIGIAGENGPELVGGPASILSRASTEKLIIALDAMREMAGARFGESGFQSQVSTSSGRMAKLKDRMKGFEGYDYSQLQAELNNRPENAPIQAVKDQWDAEERDNNIEATAHLAEIVKLMRRNVDHTARVAANTN